MFGIKGVMVQQQQVDPVRESYACSQFDLEAEVSATVTELFYQLKGSQRTSSIPHNFLRYLITKLFLSSKPSPQVPDVLRVASRKVLGSLP